MSQNDESTAEATVANAKNSPETPQAKEETAPTPSALANTTSKAAEIPATLKASAGGDRTTQEVKKTNDDGRFAMSKEEKIRERRKLSAELNISVSDVPGIENFQDLLRLVQARPRAPRPVSTPPPTWKVKRGRVSMQDQREMQEAHRQGFTIREIARRYERSLRMTERIVQQSEPESEPPAAERSSVPSEDPAEELAAILWSLFKFMATNPELRRRLKRLLRMARDGAGIVGD